MAGSQQHSPLARVLRALREEKIRFMIAGMSAAVIQGAPVVTFDTDIWIDLPPRQYMQVAAICLKLGAVMHANTVFVFPDDTMVNLLFRVTGLKSFDSEYRSARRLRWIGLRDVPVLTLNQIYRSKSAIRRPKDLVHMELLRQLMACYRRIAASGKRVSSRPSSRRQRMTR